MMTDRYRHKCHKPSLCVTCAGQFDRHERHTPLGGVTIVTLADLDEIASRVQRLTVHRRDPERFFEERSEIAHELRKLARARQ